MRRYDSYKDSGVEWIGEIPEGWEVKKFSRISYMKGRIGWQGLKQTEFTSNPGDPYLITGMNFKDGVIDWPEVYHITEERYQEAPEIQLKDNDVLITKDGSIGKLLYIDKIPYPHKASLNSHLLVLRPLDHEYYSKYLFYQLQSIIFKHHVELTKTGTTFFGITQEAMGQFKAVLPPNPEQTAIASFLDRKTSEIDQLIANKEKLIALYEEEKTSIINRAVTRGLDPDVKTNPSGVDWLGDIPEHWDVKKLKYVTSNIITGKTPPSANVSYFTGDINWFTPGDLNDGLILKNSNRTISESAIAEAGIKLFPPKTVLLIGIGATLGKLALSESGGTSNQQINAIVFDESMVNPYYGLFFLYSVKEAIVGLSNSATLAIFNQSQTKDFVLFVPPIPEQAAIVAYIETECSRLDTIIDKFKKQIELFKEYRTTLISEVVTGKIDVRDEVAA